MIFNMQKTIIPILLVVFLLVFPPNLLQVFAQGPPLPPPPTAPIDGGIGILLGLGLLLGIRKMIKAGKK